MTRSNKIHIKHLADTVATLHAAWLALVITSLPISLKWKWYRKVGAGAILATVASWVVWGDCPLFTLENRLRKQYDPEATYKGSFSAHYLHKIFSVDVPTKVFSAAGYSYAALMALLVLLDRRKSLIS